MVFGMNSKRTLPTQDSDTIITEFVRLYKLRHFCCACDPVSTLYNYKSTSRTIVNIYINGLTALQLIGLEINFPCYKRQLIYFTQACNSF